MCTSLFSLQKTDKKIVSKLNRTVKTTEIRVRYYFEKKKYYWKIPRWKLLNDPKYLSPAPM